MSLYSLSPPEMPVPGLSGVNSDRGLFKLGHRFAPGQVHDRDRGPDFTAASGAVLADAGLRTVPCNVQTPRMNAITERWTGGCRRELLDRALVWNRAHLRRILREYETCHNQRAPRR